MKTKMRSGHWSGVAAVALTLLLQTDPVWAQAPTSPDRSGSEERRRALYQEGKDAIKAQRWVDAKTKLSEAWAINPSYDVALLLAQAQFNLERFAEAATLLDYYFRNVPAKENEKTFSNAKQALKQAKAKVSTVSVTAPAGAELLLDGKPLGVAPLDHPVFVLPGKRAFELRQDGTNSVQDLQALAGSEQTVVFAAPLSSPSATSTGSVESGLLAPPPTPKADSGKRRSIVPLVVGGGAALIGIGLGVGFRVAASSSHSRFEKLQSRLGADGCGPNSDNTSDCSELRDAVETTDFRRNFSTGAFVVGGAAAIGTAVYWFWPRSDTSTAGSGAKGLRFSGGVAPGGGAIWLRGDF